MALYGYKYPDEMSKPFHQIRLPRTAVQEFDDAWISSFPEHAKEYREQLDFLVTHLNMGEEEKRHSVATRIRAHAIHPENWDACNVCHINERMDNGF
jgi:hypothetical protein